MKVEVLGCSGGKTDSANLPSFLIDGELLLDCGSVCSVLPLKKQLKIKAILVSHAHFDHICDLPFLVDNFSIAGKKINVFASEKTVELLKKNVFNNSVWPDFTEIPDKDAPVLQFNSVKEGEELEINGYKVEFFKVFHTEGSMGFIVRNNKSVLAYTADTSKADNLWEYLKLRGVQTVITECSFPTERKKLADLSNHLSVPDFLNEYRRMGGIEKVYVFHLKPHYREVIEKELKNFDAVLLKEGDIIEV